MPDSEAKKRWIKEHTTTITVKFNHNTDKELLKKLKSVDSKAGYIKKLIEQDLVK